VFPAHVPGGGYRFSETGDAPPQKWNADPDPFAESAPAARHEGAYQSTRTFGAEPGRGGDMFNLRDLFQWERFITPSIIKVFYWLSVIITIVFGVSGILSGLALLMLQPLTGLFLVISSLFGMLLGVVFVRIVAEFVLITFRINEHLGAIRNRGQI
jgi:hypothetical protein